jgi:hypothetical protein
MTITTTAKYTGASVLLATILLGAACNRADSTEAGATTRAIVQGELGQQVDQFLSQRVDSGLNGSVLIAVDGSILAVLELEEQNQLSRSDSISQLFTAVPLSAARVDYGRPSQENSDDQSDAISDVQRSA